MYMYECMMIVFFLIWKIEILQEENSLIITKSSMEKIKKWNKKYDCFFIKYAYTGII